MFVLLIGALLAAVPVGLVIAILRSFPHNLSVKANPGWVHVIFANVWVVFAARIVLISLGFVLLLFGISPALSIGVRVRRGEWLRKVGPFEPDEREPALASPPRRPSGAPE